MSNDNIGLRKALEPIVREFIAYYSHGDGCPNCGGLPHTTSCFVGRFEAALAATPNKDETLTIAHDAFYAGYKACMTRNLHNQHIIKAACDDYLARLSEENK